MSENKLIVVGAGNLAREIIYAAGEDRDTAWKTAAFVVDPEFRRSETVEDVRVISFSEIAEHGAGAKFIIGVGEPELRLKLMNNLLKNVPGAQFATVVHRSTVVMPGSIIGEGAFVAPNTTLAIGCRIGPHAVINQNVSIGHDCVVGEQTVICPGCVLSGKASIGKMTFLGSGVIVYPKVAIGDNCAVGAGVVVSRNLKSGWKQIMKPNTMLLPPEGSGTDGK